MPEVGRPAQFTSLVRRTTLLPLAVGKSAAAMAATPATIDPGSILVVREVSTVSFPTAACSTTATGAGA